MFRITLKINEENMAKGLLGLVVALVEIIEETLERQAVRRMDSGRLTEQEIERLGNSLMELEGALKKIKKENNLEESVDSVRSGLNDVADQMLSVETWEEELSRMI